MTTDTNTIHSISYGNQTINFELRRTERKSFAVHVHPNQQVEVIAPQIADLKTIYGIVQKRAYWIATQQQTFSRFQPKYLPRQCVSGETHRYLGKQYRLKIKQGEVNRIELTAEGYVSISSRHPDNQTLTKQLVEEWFRAQANEVLSDRLAFCIKRFQKPEEYVPSELIIKKLKTRWGFMTLSKKMTLNTKLIHAPLSCIDYVILHELCHIKHPNHGAKFWHLMRSIMPEWKTCKDQLENLGIA